MIKKTEISYKKHTPFRTMECSNCYSKHGKILEKLCDYDWREAFSYADFTREDVKKIIHISEGENDGDAWIGVFKLKNGKFAGLNAWCDYTGWD